MPDTSPFLDAQLISGVLYQDGQRLASRTGALLSAKIAGGNVTEALVAYAVAAQPRRGWPVLDIGCGRGASTLALSRALPASRVVALDASHAMLSATRTRLAEASVRATVAQADFHRLPLASGSASLAVAAFCLYHAPRPSLVMEEIARCLHPGGTVILATKSADSYASLDQLVARAGLDPAATKRPGLYQAFHSGNLRDTAEGTLTVRHVDHEVHRFRFQDLGHAAAYVATSPKYRLPDGLAGDPDALARRLRSALPEGPVETSSVVSYLIGTVPA